MVAVTITLMRYSIGPVYVSTPEHSNTTHVAHEVQKLSDRLNAQLRATTSIEDLMVVRAFSFEVEVDMCLAMHRDTDYEPFPIPWRFPLSLTYWTLTALGFKSDDLELPTVSEHTSKSFKELYTYLRTHPDEDDSADARTFYHDDDWDDYLELRMMARDTMSVGEKSEKDSEENSEEDSGGGYHDYVKEALEKEELDRLRRIIRRLMSLVVDCADVLAITSCQLYSKSYQKYSDETAAAFVLDKASFIAFGDAVKIVNGRPRPAVLIGDEAKTSGAISTERWPPATTKSAARARRVSVMAHLIEKGIPSFAPTAFRRELQ